MGKANGQLRATTVRDYSVDRTVAQAEKAAASNAWHIAVPFAGGRDAACRRRRCCRVRSDGRHHRGDEDGGLHHGTGCWHDRATGHLRHEPGRRWRPLARTPTAGTSCCNGQCLGAPGSDRAAGWPTAVRGSDTVKLAMPSMGQVVCPDLTAWGACRNRSHRGPTPAAGPARGGSTRLRGPHGRRSQRRFATTCHQPCGQRRAAGRGLVLR
jgi:hypothetical protein